MNVTMNLIALVQPDGERVEYVPAADRDHYKARAEELAIAVSNLIDGRLHTPSCARWDVGACCTISTARSLITRINQEDSERA